MSERYYAGQEDKSKWTPRLLWGGFAAVAIGSVLGIGVAVALGAGGVAAGGAKWGYDKWRGKVVSN